MPSARIWHPAWRTLAPALEEEHYANEGSGEPMGKVGIAFPLGPELPAVGCDQHEQGGSDPDHGRSKPKKPRGAGRGVLRAHSSEAVQCEPAGKAQSLIWIPSADRPSRKKQVALFDETVGLASFLSVSP